MALLCEQPLPPREPVQLELDLLSPSQKEVKEAFYAGYTDGHRDASNHKGKTPHLSYSHWANRPPTPGV